MNFYEALEWLDQVGGGWRVGHQTEDYDAVLVFIGSLGGSGPSRQALFNAHLRGTARESAIQRALVAACEALMVGLERPGAARDTMARTFAPFSWVSWRSEEAPE